MIYNQAKTIAEKYKSLLAPHCSRIEIAGSIRREKPEVKDVELVCIPKKYTYSHRDLFGNVLESIVLPVNGFCETVLGWKELKGAPVGKYTQRMLPEGIVLDLFMATKENWGLIFAMRTGSAEFSHKILASGWVKAGYKSVNGMLTVYGSPVPVYEEEDLFKLINVKFIQPKFRELN